MPDDTITSPVTWGILDCLASSSDAIKSIQSNRYLDIYTANGNLNIGMECPSGRILTRVQIFDNTIKCCINLYHHHRAREQQTWPKPDQAHFSDFSEIGGKEAHRNYANYFIKGNFPANHGTPPSIVCRYQLRLGKYLPKKNNNNNQPTTMEMSSEYL